MAVNFPPYYTSQILNADGKPVAGGLIRAYLTGTETPAPLFAPDGTPLGSSVSIDAAGNAVFCLRVGTTYRLRCIDADGAVVWTRDGVRALGETAGIENPMTGAGDMIVGAAGGDPARLAPGDEGDALKIVGGVPTWSTDQTGMANPMTTKGDLIVGGTDGEPDRLGVGADGDILASALFGGELSPTWEAGPKKYRNVYKNIPSPDIDDGYLGCLFYLDDTATLTLPATANIPSKSFIDFVFLDGTATLTITPQGTTTLNAQGSAVTIGGKSASFYRLTFLGHGGSGDEWAVGGTDTATQPGDHKTAVDGADASPDYLANKLSAGTGISLTNTGSAVQIAATTQTGDHQLLVSGTDASAGYLASKLTAGSNITLTQQTDGDGVQTLEISAAGGGGGGGSGTLRQTIFRPYLFKTRSVSTSYGWIFHINPETEYIDGFEVTLSSDCANIPSIFDCAIFEGNTRWTADKISGALTKYKRDSMSYMRVFGGTFNTPVHIDATKRHWIYFLTGPFGGAYFAEQIYGTVTSSLDTIASTLNAASIPAKMASVNDSDGVMPGFMLIGHNE